MNAAYVLASDTCGKAEIGVVGQFQQVVHVGVRHRYEHEHEDLLSYYPHRVIRLGKNRWLDEVPVRLQAIPTERDLRAIGSPRVDVRANLVALSCGDQRTELHSWIEG